MVLTDVNVLVYAFREDIADQKRYLDWVEAAVSADEPFGISELVSSAFVRIVSNPRIFPVASPVEAAFEFIDTLSAQPNAVIVSPGPRHWDIFTRLCQGSGARGNLVTDAYLAALAIESGSEWITTDRDFARFPGLRWRHPFRT